MLDLHTGRRRKENNNKKNETKTNNEEKNIPTAAKTHCMQVKAIMLLTLFPHAFKIGCIIHQNIRSAPICFLRWQYTTTTYFFNMPALHRNKPSLSFPPRSPKPGDHWLHLGFTAYTLRLPIEFHTHSSLSCQVSHQQNRPLLRKAPLGLHFSWESFTWVLSYADLQKVCDNTGTQV